VNEEIVAVPAGLPVLSRGAHHHPGLGSCVMEYVSVLAGEPFGDHPSCTHPVLAQLARKVNDRIGDSMRARLALLAPELVGTTGTHPGIVPAVLVRCAEAGLAVDPESRWLQRLRRREMIRLTRWTDPPRSGVSFGVSHRLFALPKRRKVDLVFTGVADILDRFRVPDRDQRMYVLLEQAVNDCRQLLGLPAVRTTAFAPGAVIP
jgi:hypothetical protein